ncbi:hypothetical protein C8Q75DRAFT_790094 [Abortiporus biennis]|nr:hypothetical protein C8Q75DRAFT_790094 [Abortiporus biennis]
MSFKTSGSSFIMLISSIILLLSLNVGGGALPTTGPEHMMETLTSVTMKLKRLSASTTNLAAWPVPVSIHILQVSPTTEDLKSGFQAAPSVSGYSVISCSGNT